jgi:hypothetical protein
MPSEIYGMIWRPVIRIILAMMGIIGMILVPLRHHHSNGMILVLVRVGRLVIAMRSEGMIFALVALMI